MRKLNLIIIVIFTLMVSANAFGQWHPEIDRVKGKVKTTKIKPNKSKGFTEVSGLTQETQYRRKHSRRKSAQYNPKEVGINKIKARKSKSSMIFDDTDGAEKVTIKQPHKGKRVHKP
ncbi:MAG: hypothetical protein K1X72_05990 [Pyrinomonadaceae bacterium]|nr:hypothetical protein [Pyrinomonadaceae bacterium]